MGQESLKKKIPGEVIIMFKSKTKVIAVLLVLIILAGIASGCTLKKGDEKTEPTQPISSQAQAQVTDKQEEVGGYKLPLTEKKVTIDYLMSDNLLDPITADMLVLKEIQERTNVYWNLISVPSTGYAEKFAITLASGDMPDILYCEIIDSKKYGPEGAFLPLNDLLDSVGPNIVNGIKERKAVKEITADDGKIYVIPKFKESIKPHSYMLRMDWMNKLQLEIPSTLDEYYNVLKAFKDADLGGDGRTIPLAVQGLGMLRAVFNTFGTEDGFVAKDGQIYYGPATPEMEDAVTYINKLYQDNLIERDFMVISRKQWEERVSTGLAGSITTSATQSDVFTELLSYDFPDAIMMPIEPIKAPDGNRYSRGISWLGAGNIAISSKSKYAELIVRQFDYVYSDEGRLLTSYGIEGDTFTYINGEPEFTEKMFELGGERFTQYAIFGRRVPVNPISNADLKRFKDTLAGEGIRCNVPYMMEPVPQLGFSSEELNELKNIETDVNDKKDAYLLKFITGDEPLSNWSKYIEELKVAGLDRMVEIYNEAYSRFD